MRFLRLHIDLDPFPRDIWLSVGQRLVCAVKAWDPDGRSVRSPERAASFGGRLVAALSPVLEREPGSIGAIANDTCRALIDEVEGIFHLVVIAATPKGLWVAGRGCMEVLALGRPVTEPIHASDTLYWSHPHVPEYQSSIVTHTISSAMPELPLRSRLVSPPPDAALRVFLAVPTPAERVALASGEERVDTLNSTPSLTLFVPDV